VHLYPAQSWRRSQWLRDSSGALVTCAVGEQWDPAEAAADVWSADYAVILLYVCCLSACQLFVHHLFITTGTRADVQRCTTALSKSGFRMCGVQLCLLHGIKLVPELDTCCEGACT
jgi:hypothetical protein